MSIQTIGSPAYTGRDNVNETDQWYDTVQSILQLQFHRFLFVDDFLISRLPFHCNFIGSLFSTPFMWYISYQFLYTSYGYHEFHMMWDFSCSIPEKKRKRRKNRQCLEWRNVIRMVCFYSCETMVNVRRIGLCFLGSFLLSFSYVEYSVDFIHEAHSFDVPQMIYLAICDHF